MADTIRRLANGGSFSLLQSKIDNLKLTYSINSCNENLNKLSDIIELTSQAQGQLLTAMSSTSAEGGAYSRYATLRARLLPWLDYGYPYPYYPYPRHLDLLQENINKDRKIAELNASYEGEVSKLEDDLRDAKDELNNTMDNLRLSRDEASRNKLKLDMIGDYERQIINLQSEISALKGERNSLRDRLTRRARSTSPVLRRARSPSPVSRLPRSPCVSPTRANLTNSIRHSRLVARFNDLYALDRMDMQDRLRRFVDDDEMVKRIIFIAVCESFHTAKMAFRSFRLRARKLLANIHTGPGELEDAVADYIVRNIDLYDVETSVTTVIRSMNVNPKISFPPECDFSLVSPFIRQACKIAFEMQALEPPLDISLATDGELFSEAKYRRSYDSEYTAPLVAYHIWPTLVESDTPLIKGECVTRRGASLSPRRSRSPSPLRTSSRLHRSSLSPERGRSTSRKRY